MKESACNFEAILDDVVKLLQSWCQSYRLLYNETLFKQSGAMMCS